MRLFAWTIAVASACCFGSSHAQELTGTLKKIKETGSITLGVRESSIPFSYLDDKQAFRGYSIDLCARITAEIQRRLGLKTLDVKLQPITSATRIPLMTNGTIDLTCGSDANTLDRQKQVAFSYTTFIGNSSFVAKKSSKVNSVNDLKGKTVVSTSGSTDVKQITDLSKERDLGLKVVVGPDHGASFAMMETGRATAFVITDILAASQLANAKNPGDFAITIIDEIPVEPWALMMRKDDPAFKALVDGVLADTFKSGEIKKLYATWFQSPLPTLNVNLGIAMSKKLQNAVAIPNDSGDPKDYK